MRLLCPKCYEEYEVTDDVIPGEGRDVQCSVCNETWFVEGEPAPLARRAIDPGVFSILQQEVQREMAARQADAQTAIKPAPAPAPKPKLKPKAQSAEPLRAKPETQHKAKTTKPDPKRKYLPPIEEVDPKRAKSSVSPTTVINLDPEDEVPPLDNRQRGILAALIVLAVLASLYIFAPNLTDAFPAYTDWVNAYVFWVDDIRKWLQNILRSVLDYRQSFG